MDNINHIEFTVNSSFSIRDLLLIGFMSVIVGLFIYFAYLYTRKSVPNKALAASFICYVPVFAFVSNAIKSNNSTVSLILILIGIFAVINAAGKHLPTSQTSQLFTAWSIVAGVLCGKGDFIAAAVLCIVVVVILVVFRVIDDDMSRLLIINGKDVFEMEIQASVFKYFNKKAKLLFKNSDKKGNIELVYRISVNVLNKLRNNRINITEVIEDISGVKNVSIVKEEGADE